MEMLTLTEPFYRKIDSIRKRAETYVPTRFLQTSTNFTDLEKIIK